jgi:hypothetical protein
MGFFDLRHVSHSLFRPEYTHGTIHHPTEERSEDPEIMAFSGRRMILRGRLDYLRHYLF